MDAPSTVADLIDRLGGRTVFARAIGIRPNNAGEMKRRQVIPVWYWHAVLKLAAEQGVDLDEASLLRMHSPAPKLEQVAVADRGVA